jgi:hypothetical protein
MTFRIKKTRPIGNDAIRIRDNPNGGYNWLPIL